MVRGPPSGVTMAGTPLASASSTTLPKCQCARGRRRGPCWRKRGTALRRADTGELRPRQSLTQPGLFSAVADDHETEFFLVLVESLLNLRQQGNILLDGKAADKAEHLLGFAVRSRAPGGMKEFGINAARHQMTRAARRAFEKRAELGIGREETWAME
jgi:hypothetical protein